MGDAIGFLDEAVRLDPRFTLGYCALAYAHDFAYRSRDPNPEQRASADAAIKNALSLQPDLPEVHLAYARHLYWGYRDYKRARVQLAIARRGLPNNVEAILLGALMDRRQGNFEKAIREFKEAMTRDPANQQSIVELAITFFTTRQFAAAEQAFNRAIDLAPDQPMFKILKAYWVTFMKTGSTTAIGSAITTLPASMADDLDVLSYQLICALNDRDWQLVKKLIEKMKGGDDDGFFSFASVPVPVDCYYILLARVQGEQSDTNASLAETRDKLNQKVRIFPEDAKLLSNLAVVDALLGKKQDAIGEAKLAIEKRPTSEDALSGPRIIINLALVYAWTNESDLAFETLGPLTRIPNGIYYGELKLNPRWDPLRNDPRFDKLLAELAPRD